MLEEKVELQELPKTMYLQRLEKLYKEYGIEKVYADEPGQARIHENSFYPEPSITQQEAVMLYGMSTTEDGEICGRYRSCICRELEDLVLFYANGKFYGVL